MLHFLVDGTCALAMYGWFTGQQNGYLFLLIYNFCAFSLQMPLGAVLDLLIFRSEDKIPEMAYRLPMYTSALGCILTMIGAFTSPVLLGIGNALFHVGGGVGTIREDLGKNFGGRALGIFVAPGALGLFLGASWTQMHSTKNTARAILIFALAMVLLHVLFAMMLRRWQYRMPLMREDENPAPANSKKYRHLVFQMLLCCFLVVMLRSYCGFTITFPWKTDYEMGLLAVSAMALGKILGGFLMKKLGVFTAAMTSLLAAAAAFCFMDTPVGGLLALLFFHMTMPMTLYLPVRTGPKYAGTVFGLLSLGLFAGFLPAWFDLPSGFPCGQELIASMICFFSMAILAVGIYLKEWEEHLV